VRTQFARDWIDNLKFLLNAERERVFAIASAPVSRTGLNARLPGEGRAIRSEWGRSSFHRPIFWRHMSRCSAEFAIC